MFVNPKEVIANGWIKFPEWMSDEQQQKCIQPNAIDFSLDKAYVHDGLESFLLSEDTKTNRSQRELEPFGGFFELSSLTDIMSDFFISVPAGHAAYLIVRSTLNRNGLYITSGLYDSGFTGNIGAVLHNRGPKAFIAPHTRIGQVIFVKSEDSGILYEGGYNTTVGQHWTQLKH